MTRHKYQSENKLAIKDVQYPENSKRTMKRAGVYIYIYIYIYEKVKDSRNRPGVAQRVPGDLGSQIP
jgi:hypothetical protein